MVPLFLHLHLLFVDDELIRFVVHLCMVADNDNEKSEANADAVECGVGR